MNFPEIDFTKPLHTQPQGIVRKIIPMMTKVKLKANVSESAA